MNGRERHTHTHTHITHSAGLYVNDRLSHTPAATISDNQICQIIHKGEKGNSGMNQSRHMPSCVIWRLCLDVRTWKSLRCKRWDERVESFSWNIEEWEKWFSVYIWAYTPQNKTEVDFNRWDWSWRNVLITQETNLPTCGFWWKTDKTWAGW